MPSRILRQQFAPVAARAFERIALASTSEAHRVDAEGQILQLAKSLLRPSRLAIGA
jgi:hypothetical protein